MRRKTNLFYITPEDSEFLTFSNYTDAMTGNFLATDLKLFPSKFLCLNVPSLSYENRSYFIEKLVSRYENKLAYMHDCCIDKNNDAEEMMKPLGWLMDTILDYDSSTKVTFVGQVTEHDYNGIYADTICVIDSQDCTYANITSYEDYSGECEDYSQMSSSYLYGWYNKIDGEKYIGPAEYKDVHPETDKGLYYYYLPKTAYLEIVHPDDWKDITFNVLIPLFDITNISYTANNDVIQDMNGIDLWADTSCIINVPYGIWFAKTPVELKRDGTSWSPAWSLAIGSQFKPFPYSKTPISEVDQSDVTAAFMTFSQALIRQNKLLSEMSKVGNSISYISNRVTALEAAVRDLGTSYNIDCINASMANIKNDLSYMQQEIDSISKN